jgi:hypothetical protein
VQKQPQAAASTLFQKPAETQNLFGKPAEHPNLFASLVRHQEPPPQQVHQDLGQKEKNLNTFFENIFQNLYLEIVKETCSLFLYKEKNLANEILEQTIEAGVKDLSRFILNEEINNFRERNKKKSIFSGHFA